MSADRDETKNGGNMEEPGELTDLLTRQEELGSEDFLPRLRRKIHRRSAGTQLATFSWELPKSVLLELAHLFKELFFMLGSGKENKP